MEVTGKIKLINETQTFGTSGFRKRELVITTDEQSPANGNKASVWPISKIS